jgi:hypothetical protein
VIFIVPTSQFHLIRHWKAWGAIVIGPRSSGALPVTTRTCSHRGAALAGSFSLRMGGTVVSTVGKGTVGCVADVACSVSSESPQAVSTRAQSVMPMTVLRTARPGGLYRRDTDSSSRRSE